MNGPALFLMLDQAAAQAAGDSASFLQSPLVPMVAIVAVMYFLMIRPQMRQQKAHKEKIAGVKKGDQVVTAGGILAKVIKVEDTVVELEIANGVKVRAVKSTLGDIVPPGGVPAAND